jgi:5-methyltetrahydrofolate--homocysteine methyltransferase
VAEVNADYDKVRTQHANKKPGAAVAAGQGARQQDAVDWSAYQPAVPKFWGAACSRTSTWPSWPYIDWGPFFQTWDLAGPYPAILTDEVVGVEATQGVCRRPGHAQKIIEGRWLTASGVMALLPANSVNDDDIELYTDDTRTEVA